jgi:hypothetical protein
LKKVIFSFLFLIFISGSLSSQKGWEVGGWLGTSWYYGELNTTLSPRKPGLALGVNGRYNFNTRVSAKAALSFGMLAAADSLSSNNFERNRNLSFKSNVYDLTGVIEFNFFEYNHGSKDAFWTPYTLVGFNVFKFNPTAELNGESYQLRKLGTEGQEIGEEYYTVSMGYVLGAGIKWDINRDWSINVEFSTRRLFTDYLDDVSTVYANPQKLLLTRGEISPQLADRSLVDGLGEPNRQRGNTNDKDVYNFFGVSFMKYFGDIECPKISQTSW